MKAVAIHLIEDYGKIVPVDKDRKEFESGDWKVSEKVARELIGGHIYLHKRQREPSFFGGEILDFRRLAEGPNAGRIVFKFKSMPECKGVKTSPDRFGREKNGV